MYTYRLETTYIFGLIVDSYGKRQDLISIVHSPNKYIKIQRGSLNFCIRKNYNVCDLIHT